MVLQEKYCWECYNFEDRGNIDETVLCAKGHHPEIGCDDFAPKYKNPPKVTSNTRFCSECLNFEDLRHINGAVLCAKNHRAGSNCDDFTEKCCYYGCCSSCDEFIQDVERLSVSLRF